MYNDNIEMQPVDSSNVDSVGYDTEKQNLYVKFKNGSLYMYLGVPEVTYNSLVGAESVGKYLNSTIKPAYPYERIA